MRRLVTLIALLAGTIIFAALWYRFVEGFENLGALYQSVTTISTVGFEEVQPLDNSGRIFTIVYILVGIGLMFYVATTMVETVVVGGLAERFGSRRASRRVRRMNDHYIVCGYGRVGREVVNDLRARRERFVVVDQNDQQLEPARALGVPVVHGDATEESVLIETGIARAQALVAAADSDVGNTYIVLTAHTLNADLFIVARAGTDSAEQRLTSAGANRVVSPYRIGGRRMALAASHPMLIDFVDHLAAGPSDGDDNILAEVIVTDDSSGLAGHTIAESCGQITGVQILGLGHADGRFTVGPNGATVLAEHDRLMLYGSQVAIESLSHVSEGDSAS